jgi:pyridoxamine 5'-phosphate oxidase
MTDLTGIRNEYLRGILDRKHADPDPVAQFGKWMEEAVRAGIEEPTAMTLATADAAGRPSARIVLLKGFDRHGFIFFTNYQSRKGQDLEANPFAALVFHWKELERQVRIEGKVIKLPAPDSDEYFASRPFESQVSAIVSPQSQVVPDRQFLIQLKEEYLKGNRDRNQRPPHWGGFRLIPSLFEFWQGRPGRLHDRIQYSMEKDSWKLLRLAP